MRLATVPQVWDRATGFVRLRRYLDRTVDGRVITVAGMRRSGNHALIAWLLAALEAARDGAPTGDGPVVHFNCLPLHRDRRAFASNLRQVRRDGIGDLLISYEDLDLRDLTDRRRVIDRSDENLYVTRSLLDLVASRIAWRAHTDPRKADELMPLDAAWLAKEAANRLDPPSGWRIVRFDDWLVDSGVRSRLLVDLGLPEVGVPTEVAAYGGGSSFTGTSRVPDAAELLRRREQVVWDPALVDLLLAGADRWRLTAAETAFLEGRATVA